MVHQGQRHETTHVPQVTLKQPLPASVAESEAITDDVLVSGALEMFGGTDAEGRGEGTNDGGPWSRSSSSSNINRPQPGAASVTSRVTGVVKSPSNHLVSASAVQYIQIVAYGTVVT